MASAAQISANRRNAAAFNGTLACLAWLQGYSTKSTAADFHLDNSTKCETNPIPAEEA